MFVKFNLEKTMWYQPEIEGAARLISVCTIQDLIPKAQWDLNTQKITMTKNPDAPIENFISIQPEKIWIHRVQCRESGVWFKTGNAGGIPYITVGCNALHRKRQVLILGECAHWYTEKHLQIVLDTLNGYHGLKGVVDIFRAMNLPVYHQYVNFLKDTFAKNDRLPPWAGGGNGSSLKDFSAENQRIHANGGCGSRSGGRKACLGAGMFYMGDLTMFATKPALFGKVLWTRTSRKSKKNYKVMRDSVFTKRGNRKYWSIDNALTGRGQERDAGLHFSAQRMICTLPSLNDKEKMMTIYLKAYRVRLLWYRFTNI